MTLKKQDSEHHRYRFLLTGELLSKDPRLDLISNCISYPVGCLESVSVGHIVSYNRTFILWHNQIHGICHRTVWACRIDSPQEHPVFYKGCDTPGTLLTERLDYQILNADLYWKLNSLDHFITSLSASRWYGIEISAFSFWQCFIHRKSIFEKETSNWNIHFIEDIYASKCYGFGNSAFSSRNLWNLEYSLHKIVKNWEALPIGVDYLLWDILFTNVVNLNYSFPRGRVRWKHWKHPLYWPPHYWKAYWLCLDHYRIGAFMRKLSSLQSLDIGAWLQGRYFLHYSTTYYCRYL